MSVWTAEALPEAPPGQGGPPAAPWPQRPAGRGGRPSPQRRQVARRPLLAAALHPVSLAASCSALAAQVRPCVAV